MGGNGMHVSASTCSLDLDRRYHRIIRCATEAFLLNGYAATSVEDIAIEASVSKPTIYKMVGDKYALATTVLENLAAGLENECRRALDMDEELENCLVKFAIAYIDWMNRRIGKTNNFAFLRLLVEMSSQHPECSKMWVDMSKTCVSGPLSEYIAKRMALGEFIEEEPLFIASQFIRMVYHSAESILAQNLHTTDVEQTRRKIRLFLGGATSEAYRGGRRAQS
jgi:TetR/AcrR family transcriptional repressor of mexJK operon